MTRNKEYVVEFNLPEDDNLFTWHGTNVYAKSPKEAMSILKQHLPNARIRKAYPGMICLYGKKWADYDSSKGAYATPANKEHHDS